MSWEDFITHVLTSSSNVQNIAIFDQRGRPVAITDGVETNESDGHAILKCLSDITKSLTRVYIDNQLFQCFHGVNQTLIGTKMKDKSCMLVAGQDGDYLIVMWGHRHVEDSYLFDLKDGLKRKAEGRLIGQVQEQPGPLLPIPPSPAPGAGPRNAVVTTDDVLVDING